MLEQIQNTLTQVETRTLDPMGYIPILSTVTGTFRAILGVAEIVSAVALLAFMQFDTAFTFFAHGVANLARASVEVIPLINLITLTYDGSLDQEWDNSQFKKKGRFEYPREG